MTDDSAPSKQSTLATTPWTALNEYVDTWLSTSEVMGIDDAGHEGEAARTERDDWMRDDAVQGLLADDTFLDLLVEARLFSRAKNKAEGRCEFCGHPAGDHWGKCRAAETAP